MGEERLRSNYLYSRSGGEYWVRSAGIMRRLDVPNTTASLEDFWNFSGRGYLEQSHRYLMMNKAQGCVMIPYHKFKLNFNRTIKMMLDGWGIKEQHVPDILERVQKYDFGRWSKEALAKDPHHSSSKFSAGLLGDVKDWFREHAEVQHMVSQHRSEIEFWP